jgi:hypothetical protein
MRKVLCSLALGLVSVLSAGHASAMSLVQLVSPSAPLTYSVSGATGASTGVSGYDLLTSARAGELSVTATGDFGNIGETSTLVISNGTFSHQVTSVANKFGEFGTGNTNVTVTKVFSVANAKLALLLTGSPLTFSFANTSLVGGFAGSQFSDVTLSYNSVPEPTTLAILGLGALGAVAARRRRK